MPSLVILVAVHSSPYNFKSVFEAYLICRSNISILKLIFSPHNYAIAKKKITRR